MGKSKDLASGAAYQDQTESDTRYVNTAGDTMTGNLVVKQSGSTFTPNGNTVALFQRNAATGSGAMVSILSGRSSAADLNFADAEDEDVGRVRYNHSDNSMLFSTSGTERLKIDSSGRITTPYQPAFNIVGTQTGYAARITAGGTTNAIPFNLARGQGTSGFNTSNGVYTAPVTGTYLFTFQTIIATGANHEIYMYKNGTLYARHYPEGGRGASFSSIIPMAVNDYIVFGCDFDVYLQHTTSNYSSVSIVLIG